MTAFITPASSQNHKISAPFVDGNRLGVNGRDTAGAEIVGLRHRCGPPVRA